MRGSLDGGSAGILQQAIDAAFRAGIRRFVFHLGGVDFLASMALGCLVGTIEEARRCGGDVLFAAVPPFVRRVFDVVGLSAIVAMAPETADALRSLEVRT